MNYIGRYRVLAPPKSGGTGEVYLVCDDRVGKRWAIKRIPRLRAYGSDGVFVLKNLGHPGIPRIVEELEDDGFVYEVMDYFEGETLLEMAEREEFELDCALDIAGRIAGILDYLHDRRIPVIYRDLKPSNILFKDGQVFLIDFDTASLGETDHGEPFGTPGYAAPEQYIGVYNRSTDLYAAGKVFLFLCDHTNAGSPLERHALGRFRRLAEIAASEDAGERVRSGAELVRHIRRIEKRVRFMRTCLKLVPAVLAAVCLLLAAGPVKEALRTHLLCDSVRDEIAVSARELDLGDPEEAQNAAERAYYMADDISDKEAQIPLKRRAARQAAAACLAGEDSTSKGKCLEAVSWLERSMEGEGGYSRMRILLSEAAVYRCAGEYEAAEQAYKVVFSFLKGAGESGEKSSLLAEAYTGLITMRLYESGDLNGAARAAGEAKKIIKESGRGPVLGRILAEAEMYG